MREPAQCFLCRLTVKALVKRHPHGAPSFVEVAIIKTVYLFTNVDGGRQFIDVLAEQVSAGSCRGVVVLSSRNWLKLETMLFLRHLTKLRILACWYSLRSNLSVHLSEDVNRDSYFSCLKPGDVGVVAGFDQIFKAGLISQFDSLVNFHLSLLPFYRGPLPTRWCLANNEEKTGITVHKLTTEIDKGDIIYQEIEEIVPGEDEFSLRSRLWRKAVPVVRQWFAHLVEDKPFTGKTVDARSAYKVHVDYKGFC